MEIRNHRIILNLKTRVIAGKITKVSKVKLEQKNKRKGRDMKWRD